MSDSELHQQSCEACQAGAPLVDPKDFPELLRQLSGWEVVSLDGVNQLQRTYTFKNFVDALTFTNKVGALAEEYNHHPEIRTEWGKVTVFWWTHKISGLHKNDFIMAAKSDQLYVG